MLYISVTRWLSLKALVYRILDQWSTLVLIQGDQSNNADTDRACREKSRPICRFKNNPFYKAYLCFLSFTLKKIHELNLEFQSRAVHVQSILKTRTTFTSLFKCFMKPSVIERSAHEEVLNSLWRIRHSRV